MNKSDIGNQEKLFNTENDYSKNRFTGAFYNNLEGTTKLIQEMWKLNDFTNYKLSYYRPYLKLFLADMFCAMIAAGITLVFPMIIRYITGTVLIADNFERMANELRKFTKEKQVKNIEVMEDEIIRL